MTEDTYTVSNYLVDRLKEVGIQHLFGVPGDYAFPALAVVQDDPDLEWVGACNELDAALAADGYARAGRIGACLFTAGPGEIGAAAGIGGSFSERQPVIIIAGHPPLVTPAGGRFTHHGFHNDFAGFTRIFAEFTVAQTDFSTGDPGAEIDRVIQACWRERRPVYIQFPKDVQTRPIARPNGRLVLPEATSDPSALQMLVKDLQSRIAAAERPAMLINYPVGRFALTSLAEQFAAATGIPFAATFQAASASIDRGHPQYMGVYLGRNPGHPVSDRLDAADLLIRLAMDPDESARGLSDPSRTAPHIVDLQIESASVAGAPSVDAAMGDVLRALIDGATKRPIEGVQPQRRNALSPRPHTDMTEEILLDGVVGFIEPDDVVVVDVGTCNPIENSTLAPRATVISQFSWAGIGYVVPMTLGSLLARPESRHVLIAGDGGLQITVQELSTILRHGFAPIVIVLNNQTYLIENVSGLPSQEDNSYNVLQNWDYAALPAVFHPGTDAFAVRVHTEEQFADALQGARAAQAEGRFSLVEVVLSPTDVNQSLLTLNATIAAG